MSDSTGVGVGPASGWLPLEDCSIESPDARFINHKTVAEIRDHFSNLQPRFKFEGIAGKGAAGFVFRLVESGGGLLGLRGRVRRLALKRSSTPSVFHEELLRTEIQWLKRLANGDHIVRMLAYRDEPRDAPRDEQPKKRRFERMRRWQKMVRREKLGTSLEGLTGPVYIMEHLENGTLYKFSEIIEHENYRVPNKVLWSFLLCLMRGCAAMGYPLNNMEAKDTQLEETLPMPPYNLCHSDLHMSNAMMGDMGNFPEHEVVPGLKLIDFGFAEERPLGAVNNMYQACLLIVRLITRQHVVMDEIRDFAGGQLPLSIEMLGTWHERYPRLCPVLTDLLARAVAYDHDDRPSLAEMIATASRMAAQLGYSPPGHDPEPDVYVRAFLQNMLFEPPARYLELPAQMPNDAYHIVSGGLDRGRGGRG